ncbi:hypothetical protein ACFODL_06200 [Phenylobacterium terrae]|uniref:Uncharacterized protein n=1 Tax=Phenylobacterium terrae TaxID=2665495 RepID=A0ABW4N6D0_9CAUL
MKLERLLKDRIGSRPSSAPLTVSSEIVLVQSDLMLPDLPLKAWLDQVGPLDAVTMWFSGVLKGRVLTKIAHDIGATSDLDLREALEDEVVELAAKRLRPGGVLQIVQRGAGDMEGERQKWAAIVAGIAADHGFDVVSVTGMPYEEPPVGRQTAVNRRRGARASQDDGRAPRVRLRTRIGNARMGVVQSNTTSPVDRLDLHVSASSVTVSSSGEAMR